MQAHLYQEMFTDVIQSWRQLWGYEFPFLFVQLAPYGNVRQDVSGESWAWLRDAQTQTAKTVPNADMVVITDAGEEKDIHPHHKRIPGERLAMKAIALENPDVDASSPEFEGMRIDGNKVVLKFSNVSGGLEVRRVAMNRSRGFLPGEAPDAVVLESLTGFKVAGADGNFVDADAKIVSKDTVLVHSEGIEAPKYVRYGWTNFTLCNLYGGNGMPAIPFRTDSLDMPEFRSKFKIRAFGGERRFWGTPLEVVEVADGAYTRTTLDEQEAYTTKNSQNYLYLKHPQTGPRTGILRIVYLDKGSGSIEIRYDSTSNEIIGGTTAKGVWKNAGLIGKRNTGTWRVVEVPLQDGRFEKRCNGGDFRLSGDIQLAIVGAFFEEK